jgi:peptidoglycan/LPS O-acetylase OafA/YrhL
MSRTVSVRAGTGLATVARHQHFHSLDGLRGVAALAVLILHGAELARIGYVPPSAGLAVDFFFLLSGFVIAHAYDARLGGGGMTAPIFMRVRLTRLYPMLFIGCAIGGMVFLIGQRRRSDGLSTSVDILMVIGSFLLLPSGFATGIAKSQAYPTNNPIWSLFWELAVNAVYGSRFGRLSNRALAAVVAVSGAAMIATLACLWPGSYQDIGFASPTLFLLGAVRVSYPFWAGVLMFRLMRGRALPRLPIGVAGLLLALALLLPLGGTIYTLLLVVAGFPALVALSADTRLSRPMVRVCAACGELSYPLYLTHQPVFRALVNAVALLHLAVPPWLLLLVGAALSIVIAQILLVGFDRPVRRRLRRLVAATQPAHAGA